MRTALALGALVFGTSPVVITSLPRPALLPNAPERITWQAGHVHVHTYDHNVVVLLRGE